MLTAFARGLVAHPHYKLLAVAAAVGTWLYVQGEQIEQATERIPIEWILPEGFTTVEGRPPTVSVSVSGSLNALKRARQADMYLSVNLLEVVGGVGDYTIEYGEFPVRNLPAGITVSHTSPAAVTLQLDTVATRVVPVHAVYAGEPANGYKVDEVTVRPAVVELHGPKVLVDELESVDTEPVDVSSLRHDRRFEVDLDLPGSVRATLTAPFEARVDVEPVFETRMISTVPVQVLGHRNYVANRDTVQVKLEGPADALRTIRDAQIVAMAYLPQNPNRSRYELSFSHKDGPRVEVLLPTPEVRVVSVDPAVIKVVRQ